MFKTKKVLYRLGHLNKIQQKMSSMKLNKEEKINKNS